MLHWYYVVKLLEEGFVLFLSLSFCISISFLSIPNISYKFRANLKIELVKYNYSRLGTQRKNYGLVFEMTVNIFCKHSGYYQRMKMTGVNVIKIQFCTSGVRLAVLSLLPGIICQWISWGFCSRQLLSGTDSFAQWRRWERDQWTGGNVVSSKPKKNTYRFEFLKKSNTATHVTIKVIEDSVPLRCHSLWRPFSFVFLI